MSELINSRSSAGTRLQLLASVSAFSLLTVAASQASAEDTDHPTVWIELGAQLERIDSHQDAFLPPVLASQPSFLTLSPSGLQRPSSYGFGGEGKISFTPQDSDWVFSAAVRYGRSNGARTGHQQTNPEPQPWRFGSFTVPGKYSTPPVARNFDGWGKNSSSHAVLDFQAGKDVGLGVVGSQGSSLFSFGVRFAQFTAKSSTSLNISPSPYWPTDLQFALPRAHRTDYAASANFSRSFRGIGPAISWDASAALAGSKEDGEISFDWGLNGAVLFGRRKVAGYHATAGHYYKSSYPTQDRTLYNTAHNPVRARSIIVPNFGGFAGLSFRFPNAKLSMGYRADLFLNAMDGGIDTRKNENIGFYGPFATISIGLGG